MIALYALALLVSIQEIRHPLIQHKLGLLRRTDISTKFCVRCRQSFSDLLPPCEPLVIRSLLQKIY